MYILVFYHNQLSGNFNPSSPDVLSINETYKYSILGNLSNLHKDSESKYTFAIVYDEIKTYNVWKQTNMPLDEIEYLDNKTLYNATGYEPVKIRANRMGTDCIFGGITVSKHKSKTYFDGCPGGDTWYFSIGYTGASWANAPKIPANSQGVTYMTMWAKIPIPQIFMIGSCKYNNYVSFRFSSLYVIIILFL